MGSYKMKYDNFQMLFYFYIWIYWLENLQLVKRTTEEKSYERSQPWQDIKLNKKWLFFLNIKKYNYSKNWTSWLPN